MRVGDFVVKNEALWCPNAFDGWGRGVGVGVIVEPPFAMDDYGHDVMWPGGRCFEKYDQLLPTTPYECWAHDHLTAKLRVVANCPWPWFRLKYAAWLFWRWEMCDVRFIALFHGPTHGRRAVYVTGRGHMWYSNLRSTKWSRIL